MTAKRRRLGRGLDALLQGAKPKEGASPAEASPGVASLESGVESGAAVAEATAPSGGRDGSHVGRTLPTSKLRPNRLQPRSYFDDAALEELTESIRAQGVVQPIVVTREGEEYAIIAGERRWRAAQRAGLTDVPVYVRDVADDRELLALALVENVQRADLNPMEEAEAYELLAKDYGLSQEEIGRLVGKSRATVANTLRLLRLSEPVRDLLRTGALSAGQARPLLSLDTEAAQVDLAERAVAEGLTARRLEKLTGTGGRKTSKRSGPVKDANTQAAEAKLERTLQTKVEIRRSGSGGTVALHFHSEEELMGIYDLLMSAGDKR